MNTNSEQQDRFLEDLCACSEALSVLAERLEAEGRPWDALTDAERRQVEAIGRRVETVDRQLDECAKERRLDGEFAAPFTRGLRV
ncbi:hypothetical protein [uncultured Bilophila sp.]|uniref:hypothetical protein n=1 Tax=uncultured Bilophila sp. TaxID=529385 RepID=UPI0026DC3723|nr:hypothetical protein [uncultured Bilophila sp.]